MTVGIVIHVKGWRSECVCCWIWTQDYCLEPRHIWLGFWQNQVFLWCPVQNFVQFSLVAADNLLLGRLQIWWLPRVSLFFFPIGEQINFIFQRSLSESCPEQARMSKYKYFQTRGQGQRQGQKHARACKLCNITGQFGARESMSEAMARTSKVRISRARTSKART